MQRSAVISSCGRYRYRLDRRWADGRNACFIMLNPSTADGEQDDPTIRRCVGFAKREGCGSLTVVNLFPYRATKPADLWATDPLVRCGDVRAEMEFHRAASDADILIAAWGADTRGRERWTAERFRDRLVCLGKTKAGQPRHPLYLPGDTPLIPLAGGSPQDQTHEDDNG